MSRKFLPRNQNIFALIDDFSAAVHCWPFSAAEVPPNFIARKVARFFLDYVFKHPSYLALSQARLTSKCTLLWCRRHGYGYSFQFPLIAEWLIHNNMRVLLTLTPGPKKVKHVK